MYLIPSEGDQMKSTVKKIAAVLLTFSFLAASISAAKATDEEEPVTETTTVVTTESSAETTEAVTGTTETTAPSETDQPSQPEEENENVAEMSICMQLSGFPAVFHVWIYIQNISEETLKVGLYDLPTGEGVSVGTWGVVVDDGWGVYYNIEAYGSGKEDIDYYTLTKSITLSDLEKISKKITSINYWDPFINCTVFSYRLWNCVSGKWLLPIPLPWITFIQMAVLSADKNGIEMFVPEIERVFRQKGRGEDAYLEQVGEETLKDSIEAHAK